MPEMFQSESGPVVVTVHGGTILVDAQDAALACEPGWGIYKKGAREGYVMRSRRVDGKTQSEILHRVIMGAPKGMLVDHRDGNRRNNTRGNLRVCTPAQNSANRHAHRIGRSRYRGVSWNEHPRATQWSGTIRVLGRTIRLGRFATEEEAARAYDDAARKHYGEFARLNFARPGEQSALREESAA